ncbi:hypothetical protein [Campylobacter sp. RM16192]|uniref:hypothetical protein n=1 Tax=Campylobacter sp. RM16192 TaxID=1660080 RepID=UPI0014526D31|nr:hypothetical protein [Campylobacter sp. RM16192]QCD52493.1 hypothetical protein CDOMC_0870 [Campylobacter sp. RM16192]
MEEKREFAISINDKDVKVDCYEVKEYVFVRQDRLCNVCSFDALIMAEEYLEFLDVEYEEIVEAKFKQKDKRDCIELWVKVLANKTQKSR